MTKRPVVKGERPPMFLSKADLAAELSASVSTVDEWTRHGILPQPRRYKGAVRYFWPEVVDRLAPPLPPTDPFKEALGRVT
ncbi:transcriptional regulator [Paracoccus sp. MBLB3053]|uniref:Transcriptional regulator n=1 Tax=Paracoccus aurantius TaxID=3073814 RepID=A0ABU2HVC5_9RHOB|nr:transcriptional regulator [Paracoccus sp. MBLB3053]MDS9468692.1 transcriptional regulator [Paracoccus sp. MBLB3053]